MAQHRDRAQHCPTLTPLTPEARQAVPEQTVPLDTLPFRLGRDLRDDGRSSFRLFRRERRQTDDEGPNNLYLAETDRPHRVSRKHLLIGEEGGRYYLEDRKSTCGTLVEGEAVGGRRQGGRRWLDDGDVIILGGNHSPFVFKFHRPNGSGD
jgi:pSer/pThr/pTyr-binding forkhead associated (FHA) protein